MGMSVPPTTISDETVEAAARALYEAYWEDSTPDTLAAWELITERDRQECVEQALAAVLAAVPYIEAGLRANDAATIDAAHLQRQREFSLRTFGPGSRAKGVVAHIRKELDEVEADPTDLSEWIDVAILALDGAWRSGAAPQQIIDALIAKQARNEAREWPDWRTAGDDAPIEHVRSVAARVARGTQEATK